MTTTIDLTKDDVITAKLNDTTYKITRDNLIKAVINGAVKAQKNGVEIKFEKLVCNMCAAVFYTETVMMVHELKVHWVLRNGLTSFIVWEKGEQIPAAYMCIHCGGGFPSVERLKIHVTNIHGHRFVEL